MNVDELKQKANIGDISSMLELGKYYYERKDEEESKKYYLMAAENGNLYAMDLCAMTLSIDADMSMLLGNYNNAIELWEKVIKYTSTVIQSIDYQDYMRNKLGSEWINWQKKLFKRIYKSMYEKGYCFFKKDSYQDTVNWFRSMKSNSYTEEYFNQAQVFLGISAFELATGENISSSSFSDLLKLCLTSLSVIEPGSAYVPQTLDDQAYFYYAADILSYI